MIAGAANETAVMEKAVTQMTQDLRLSMVGTGAVEAIVEETLVLADIIEIPELVAKHPTRRRHRQGDSVVHGSACSGGKEASVGERIPS